MPECFSAVRKKRHIADTVLLCPNDPGLWKKLSKAGNIHVLQITVNQQKGTFPIDADFSEKELIIDLLVFQSIKHL